MAKSRGASNNRRKSRGDQASSLPPRPPLPHAVTSTEAIGASESIPDDSFQRTTKQLIRFGSEKHAGQSSHGKWLIAVLWAGVAVAMLVALFLFFSGA